MAQQSKCVPLYMQPDEYARFERAAIAEEREPVQQAQWLIKRWLAQLEREKGEPLTAA